MMSSLHHKFNIVCKIVTTPSTISNERIRGTRKVGEIAGKAAGVVWACDEKRGALRRKEGDGNESRPTREKEERKA